jgi:hypothetical protein
MSASSLSVPLTVSSRYRRMRPDEDPDGEQDIFNIVVMEVRREVTPWVDGRKMARTPGQPTWALRLVVGA